jgi:hypothetical protein
VAAIRLPRCTNSGHVGGADLVAAFVRKQKCPELAVTIVRVLLVRGSGHLRHSGPDGQ